MKTVRYEEKTERFTSLSLYKCLDETQREFLLGLARRFRFTFQEFRQTVEACRDLEMWNGNKDAFRLWVENQFGKERSDDTIQADKKVFLKALRSYMTELKNRPKHYSDVTFLPKPHAEKKPLVLEKSDKQIFGWCPVASEKTVCCNLRTIDAVESCAFGCSYCTIQTFYSDRYVFDAELAKKLEQIPIDPGRFYHIGTGQSSDSLVWGNRNGMLDDLTAFARKHPNVLLEFKTKSDKVDYFLQNGVPPNIVLSWSLNPQIIIDREEHFTAGLDKRLNAARAVAERGIKVAFHFHPIIYYDGWEWDYPDIARRLQEMFRPQDVLFISFGSVTFIKPVIKKIRKRGITSKILQMDFVTDPHGKLTYSDDIKIRKFRQMYHSFTQWHNKVFFYLCMEKADIWKAVFGRVYETNEDFEADMIRHCMRKIDKSHWILNEILQY